MEKRKWIEYPIALLLLLVIFGLPIAIADQYAWSPVYFSVPVSISFTLTLPGVASNTSQATAPGAQTDDIYFNATTGDSKDVNAARGLGASGTDVQDADSGRPILQFKNTGTVNISIGIAWNTTPAAEYEVYANISFPANSSGTAAANKSTISTTILRFVDDLPPNNYTEVYLWANFTNAVGGTSSRYELLYNSSTT